MCRSKEIESSEKMWELFEKYYEATKNKPFKVQDFVGKDGDEVDRIKERPLTVVGFYNYCRRNATDVHNYFENTESRYDDYEGICRAIRDEIKQDQIEGGMAGIYNPSITQRLNGLADKRETEVKSEPRVFDKVRKKEEG